jgi:hypothetical protein
VAGENGVFFVDENGDQKSEGLDAFGNLLNLLFRVRPRIARIRLERVESN